jgi:hypothetical protein
MIPLVIWLRQGPGYQQMLTLGERRQSPSIFQAPDQDHLWLHRNRGAFMPPATCSDAFKEEQSAFNSSALHMVRCLVHSTGVLFTP